MFGWCVGAAYMPIDVSYPIPLLEDIFADAKPIAVFADPDVAQYIPGKLCFSPIGLRAKVCSVKIFYFCNV